MIVSGENRYLFQRYTRDGSYAAAINIWNWTLTRADPVSATVRAEYATYALNPRVIDVRRTLDTPVPITTNLVATLVFDRTMDPTVVPTVTFSNFNGTVIRTLPLAGGVWQRINTTTDSYRCPPASFARGEDGTYALVAAAARDPFGSIMMPTNAWIFTVDATRPRSPLRARHRVKPPAPWAGLRRAGRSERFPHLRQHGRIHQSERLPAHLHR